MNKGYFKKRRANSRDHRDCLIQENRLESLKNERVSYYEEVSSVLTFGGRDGSAYLQWSKVAVRV